MNETFRFKASFISKYFIFAASFIFIFCACPKAADAQPDYVELPFLLKADNSIIIGNTQLERHIYLADGKAVTSRITNNIAKTRIPASPQEFEITLMDGARIPSSEFQFVKDSSKYLKDGSAELTLEFKNEQRGIEAKVIYTLAPASYYMRKKLLLRASGDAVNVDSITVDFLSAQENIDMGGLGQPVYIDRNAFAGIEHPAGHNIIEGKTTAALSHNPGWRLNGEWQESKTAVLGVSKAYEVREQFNKYVDSIARPPMPIVVYNSWFDVRRENMSSDYFKELFDAFKKNMPANMDSIVIDDGWQEPMKLWEPEAAHFPEGFDGLSEYLRSLGSNLGLWMPLCGYGLDLPYSPPAGFEVSPAGNYFCLAGGNYRDALKKRLEDIIVRLKVNYLKHDFNFLSCVGDKPGHRPTERQSIEANVDAEIELLDYMHSLNPNVFLNVTSYVWLSPWWLKHADALWIGSSDYGWNTTVPAFDKRNPSNTYYDEYIYRRLRTERAQVRPHILMTHGIIDSRLLRLGGEDESYSSWIDNVMLYLGRGVMMRELYLSPELLDSNKWNALGEALKWAESKTSLFVNGEMLGGNPSRGEPYWYRFTDGKRELFTLRAPSHLSSDFSIQLKSRENLIHLIYPFNLWMSEDSIDRFSKIFLQTPPHSVALFETVPFEDIKRPVVIGLPSKIIRQTPTETEYELTALPINATFGLRSSVKTGEVLLDGKKLEAPTGWYVVPFDGDRRSLFTKPIDPDATVVPASDTFKIKTKTIVDAPIKDARLTFVAKSLEADPPSSLLFDGKLFNAEYKGPGWAGFVFPLATGTTYHTIEYSSQTFHTTPFATTTFNVDIVVSGIYPGAKKRLIVKHDPAPEYDLLYPPLPMQDYFINAINTQKDMPVSYAEFVPANDFPSNAASPVKAAKIKLKIFGSRPGGPPRSVTVNNAPAAGLPNNSFPFFEWEEYVLDLSPASLKAIRKENRIAITNLGGAPFKFKDVTLSVQLENGSWINSDTAPQVQHTGDGWEFAEGDKFKGNSKPVKVSF